MRLLLIIAMLVTAGVFYHRHKEEREASTQAATEERTVVVLNARGGDFEFDPQMPSAGTLTLRYIAPMVGYVVQGKECRSDQVPLQQFISQWQTGTFTPLDADANSSYFSFSEGKQPPSALFALSHPRYETGTKTLTFEITGWNLTNKRLQHLDNITIVIEGDWKQ